MRSPSVISCDVGTGSVRAAIFSARDGARLSSTHLSATRTRAERRGHFEQSSADIWGAVVCAVGAACEDAGADVAASVAAIAFDATCSLVAVRAADGAPLSVAEGGRGRGDGDAVFDVVLWCDHRSVPEADEMNRLEADAVVAVRRHFGGKLSAENQPPKLAHLQKHMPSFADAAFFDLSDWLTFRCLGGAPADAPRSSCTVACKWGWGPLASCDWSPQFWRDVGLASLLSPDGSAVSPRIGTKVVPPGTCVGTLSESAATELGLSRDVRVAAGMIDAHAGALAMLNPEGEALDARAPLLENRFAMICGTSTCHIAVTPKPLFVDGVWGPYRDAVFAGYWCAEGGQSATGAFIDNVLSRAAASISLRKEAEENGMSIYDLLEMRSADSDASHVHILPYPNGNRSPRADPTLREVVSGLRLTPSSAQAEAELIAVYKASVQSLALGARHIVERLEENGHKLTAIIVCGSQAKSALFRRSLADACKIPVMMLKEEDSVLCGTAILAASSASTGSELDGKSSNIYLLDYAKKMSAISDESVIEPCKENFDFLDRKYKVYLRMCDDFLAYRSIMDSRV